MARLRISLAFLLSIIFTNLFAQKGVDESEYLKVIRKNKKGNEFVYDASKGEIADKTWLRYLGNITTKQGIIYKVVTSIWVWGYSKRGTTRILLFDSRNRYVGNFVLGMTYEAPTKVRENKLIFEYPKGESCDYKLKREVSFADGIPKQFFLVCKDGMGDIYYFDTSKQRMAAANTALLK